MKKLLVFAMATMLVGGVAFAATIQIPWFIDNAGDAIAGSGGVPSGSTGGAAWVRVKNNHTASVVCTITYYDRDGVAIVPTPNTFGLTAGQVLAFRPGRDDVAEGAQGRAVPNSTSTSGSAVVTSGGPANTLIGVVSSIRTTGDESSYLVPPAG